MDIPILKTLTEFPAGTPLLLDASSNQLVVYDGQHIQQINEDGSLQPLLEQTNVQSLTVNASGTLYLCWEESEGDENDDIYSAWMNCGIYTNGIVTPVDSQESGQYGWGGTAYVGGNGLVRLLADGAFEDALQDPNLVVQGGTLTLSGNAADTHYMALYECSEPLYHRTISRTTHRTIPQ